VAVWAIVCGLALRVPFSVSDVANQKKVLDERSYYVTLGARRENPVTLEDYRADPWAQSGLAMRRRAAAGEHVVTFKGPNFDKQDESLPDTPTRPGLPVNVVAPSSNVGLFGYAAGTDVWVVDRLGITDPIAARERLAQRGRVGHEKVLPALWVAARFSDPKRLPPVFEQDPGVELARQALDCRAWVWDGTGKHLQGPLRKLLGEISQPMSAGRFLANVSETVSGGKFRLPLDPAAAKVEMCG
jgi:arabinofuranosyltransferase